MDLLLFPYIFNIIILTPVGLITLLGGAGSYRLLFHGKYVDSPGPRHLLGALWTALLICSVLGLFFPVTMTAILLIQIIYKTLWWLVFVIPRLLAGRPQDVHWPMALVFVFILLTYPWVIPWSALFSR